MMNVLTSWLIDGTPPVSMELAQKRGEICAKCPLNITENWWEKISKQPIAEVIKKWLEIKGEMKIAVKIEKDLGVCRACGCVLSLKVHEPLKYITAHTDRETMDKYVPQCWVKNEGKEIP